MEVKPDDIENGSNVAPVSSSERVQFFINLVHNNRLQRDYVKFCDVFRSLQMPMFSSNDEILIKLSALGFKIKELGRWLDTLNNITQQPFAYYLVEEILQTYSTLDPDIEVYWNPDSKKHFRNYNQIIGHEN